MTEICASKNCMQIATNHYKAPMCKEHYEAWFRSSVSPDKALELVLEEETLDGAIYEVADEIEWLEI